MKTLFVTSTGSCDDIKLNVQLQGGNPGRLRFTWSVALEAGQPSLGKQDGLLLQQLSATLQALPDTTMEYVVAAIQSAIFDKRLEFTVRVTNFLDVYGEGKLSIVRENKQLPMAQLTQLSVSSKVSQEISLNGEFLGSIYSLCFFSHIH